MFRRDVLLLGGCVLFFVASFGIQAAAEWGPRTLHPAELYAIHGGGQMDKCCDRMDDVCEKDPEDDEGGCQDNASGTGCKQPNAWLVNSGNKKFCIGELPMHYCSDSPHDQTCQSYFECVWHEDILICLGDSILSRDSASMYCSPDCPVEAPKD